MTSTVDAALLQGIRARLLKHIPGQIDACLAVLTDEDLVWRPNESVNAAGNLIIHLSWSNRYYLEQVIGGRDVGRNREAEFTARNGLSRAEVLPVWEQSRRITASVLESLTPPQLMQTTDRGGTTKTYAEILLHVSHHNATHMGQIVWITKVRRPGALDDIWRKTPQE